MVDWMDQLKYLFEKPTLSGRLLRWLILLAEFDLKNMARRPSREVSCQTFALRIP